MKTLSFQCAALAAGLIATSHAEQPAPRQPSTSATNAAPRRISYRAATGSAPAALLTGGSRGSGDATVRLDVLAPDEVGLTTQEQPSLFWYQSKPAAASFELTLLEESKIKPVLQVKMDRSANAGIQRIKLSDHGIKLAKGVEYRWVVALVTDPGNRSSDLVASSSIQRVDPSKELQQKLAKAAPADRPGIYAEAGIWHDALASLSDLIDTHPKSEVLREERADLLRQVGLKAAAGSEDGSKPNG